MTTNETGRPVGDRAARKRFAGATQTIPRANDIRSQKLGADWLEQVTLRAVQDALAGATRGYWERRAAVLEDARPRRGDFHGEASRESLRARYDHLTRQAEQCRVHALVLDHDDVSAALVAEMLGWEWLEAIAAAETVDEDAERAEFERFAASWESIPEGVAA